MIAVSASSSPPYYLPTLDGVDAACHTAPRLFLCLDYDGTLVPITSRPEEAQPSATLLALLKQLAQVPHVKVALMSGRPLAELCALAPIEGAIHIGTHGMEMRTPTGRTQHLIPAGAFTSVVARFQRDLNPVLASKSGFLLENKKHTLAVHYRLAQEKEAEEVVSRFLAIAQDYRKKGVAVEVLHGKKVIEVRPVGVNKGKAVQSLLEYRDNATLFLYFGDDATDEDAFQVLSDRGLTVLVADPPHRTAAHCYLKNPDEVSRFLSRVIRLRGQG